MLMLYAFSLFLALSFGSCPWMGDYLHLWTGKPSGHITNAKVNSALHSSGTDKSCTGLSG